PEAFLDELMRLLKPGGLLYFSYTLWLSPWGGHETSPWHYLGGNFAARRFLRRKGHDAKNLFGRSLFARHAGKTLRRLRSRDDIVIKKVLPRYYPRWMAWVVRVPVLREFLTWNLLVIAERAAETAP
ncbi:MAG: SAM-dependent methyltransferase, partial [Actinobacteria bacterium]|nr:SAM-dependent methyltransferase [Actinomycetota bacterium]